MPRKAPQYCAELSSDPMGGFCRFNAAHRVKIGSKPFKLMCGRHKNASVKKHGKKAMVKPY